MSDTQTCNNPVGNLALSRAIGDYNFKHNTDLPQEQQIITGIQSQFVY